MPRKALYRTYVLIKVAIIVNAEGLQPAPPAPQHIYMAASGDSQCWGDIYIRSSYYL